MNHRGVTLIELLVVLILSSIAMMAVALPLVADRTLWASGNAQAESQRDAEIAFRALTRFARESKSFTVGATGPAYGKIQFIHPDGTQMCFEGGPSFPGNNNKFRMGGQCVSGGTGGAGVFLIDGNRSKVVNSTGITGFTITPIIPNKLVRVRLEVQHKNRENEILETELALRNGS